MEVKVASVSLKNSLGTIRLLCLKEKPVSGPALSPDFFFLKHRDDFIHVPASL